MIAGQIRTVTSLEELRELPAHAVISDARGWCGVLAQRATSPLVGGVYWAGTGGICDAGSIEFPVQAWWPDHPDLVKVGAGDG